MADHAHPLVFPGTVKLAFRSASGATSPEWCMSIKATLYCGFGLLLALSACSGQPTTLHGADAQVVDRTCVRSTGSHIRRAGDACLPVAGRTYGKSDIDRTGTNDMGQALATMDPSIRIGR